MKAVIDPGRCKACGLCAVYCPKGALAPGEALNAGGYRAMVVDEERCVGCGACYTVCPDGAFSILERGE